jgi:NADH:ubiquinone oxidoreductase subunit K
MVTRASRQGEAADAAPGAAPGADERGGARWNATAARVRLRRHWLFALLFTLGVLLRVMAQVAYQPAILYYDSAGYLGAYRLKLSEPDPLGYPLTVRLLLGAFHDLAGLAAFNHLLGLAIAGLIYAVLLRRGVKPWMAALAAGPVLLDGLQLLVEQMVMSEPLFQFFVVLGITLLLWRPRPAPVMAAAAGVSFAAAALTRYVGLSLVLAGLVFCGLAAGRRVVSRLVTAAALLAAFALPMIGYAGYNDAVNGAFAVTSGAVSTGLYARVAASVTCPQLSLPSYERPLCPPKGAVKPRAGSLIQGYALGTTSPLVTYRPPRGETTRQVLNDFVKRAVLQQPLAVARSVGGSLVWPFLSWRRDHRPGELPVERWQFQTKFPLYFTHISLSLFHRWEGHRPVINRPLARLLRGYQLSLGYTPGPVLLACVILALAAGLGAGRARRSGQQLACLLWLAAGLGLLLAADLYEFSWRYQLPTLVTIPPAAALALSALTSPRTAREPPTTQEPGGPGDSAPAMPDDTAASRHPARVEPAEGMAHTHQPAEPGPAQHHVHAGNSLDPEGTQASPGAVGHQPVATPLNPKRDEDLRRPPS